MRWKLVKGFAISYRDDAASDAVARAVALGSGDD
jgi:hypothetical protein